MLFNIELDTNIINIIEKKGEIRYNELFRSLYEINNENGKKLSKRTFNNHINRLKDMNIIKANKYYNAECVGLGKTVISLSGTTISQRRFGYFAINYSDVKRLSERMRGKIDDRLQIQKRRQLYLHILFQTAIGFEGIRIMKGEKIQKSPSGNTFVLDTKEKPIPFRSHIQEGFSINDPMKNKVGDDFFDSNRFKKSEIQNVIELIEQNEINPIVWQYKKKRIKIVDSILEELIMESYSALFLLVQIWQTYLLVVRRKPKSKDSEWLAFVLGNKKTMNFLSRIESNRNTKKSLEDIYIEFNGLDTFYNQFPSKSQMLKKVIESINRWEPEYFDSKLMQNLFDSGKRNRIKDLTIRINKINELIPELINRDKSKFMLGFLDLIKFILSPPFSKKWYEIKFNVTRIIN